METFSINNGMKNNHRNNIVGCHEMNGGTVRDEEENMGRWGADYSQAMEKTDHCNILMSKYTFFCNVNPIFSTYVY